MYGNNHIAIYEINWQSTSRQQSGQIFEIEFPFIGACGAQAVAAGWPRGVPENGNYSRKDDRVCVRMEALSQQKITEWNLFTDFTLFKNFLRLNSAQHTCFAPRPFAAQTEYGLGHRFRRTKKPASDMPVFCLELLTGLEPVPRSQLQIAPRFAENRTFSPVFYTLRASSVCCANRVRTRSPVQVVYKKKSVHMKCADFFLWSC